MNERIRIAACTLLGAYAGCLPSPDLPEPASPTHQGSQAADVPGPDLSVAPPAQAADRDGVAEQRGLPEPTVKWTRLVTHPTESFIDVSVAVNPNGTTGLFAEIELPRRIGGPDSYAYHAAEVRTYDPAGTALWTKRSGNEIVGVLEDAARHDSYEIESWSASFVVLRKAWRAYSEAFSFGCANTQNPEESSSFAAFLDERGACPRQLGLGSAVCAFAADPAGTVWYSYTVPGMAGQCHPPRKVDANGQFLFHGGFLGDGSFDRSTMLEGPFTRFADGRIFGRGSRSACPTCPAEPVFGPLEEDFRPGWTASGREAFNAGDGDVASVGSSTAPVSFGATSVPGGEGLVAFRYDSSGAPKRALRGHPPFEGARLLHVDAQGFVYASDNSSQPQMRVAAVGWDGAARWSGLIDCGAPSAFAADPEHGLRFACLVGAEDGGLRSVRLIALER